MLDLLLIGADLTTSAWIFASLAVFVQRRRAPDASPDPVSRWVWAELRPFFLPAVVVRAVGDVVDDSVWFAALFAAINLVCWWFYKDIDDDRWKRRREKAAATVRQVGARLTVAPVPAAGGA